MVRASFRSLVVAACLGVLSTAPDAPATTFVLMDEHELAARSDVVVAAVVSEIEVGAHPATGGVRTYVTLEPIRVFAGDVGAGAIVLEEPGGEVAGLRERVYGAPEYVRGEAVLVFVNRRADGSLRTTGLSMGKYALDVDVRGAVRATRRMGRDVSFFDPFTGHLDTGPVVETRQLGDLVGRLARSAGAAASGYEDDAEVAWQAGRARTEYRQSFAFFANPARWFEPDQGQPVLFGIDGTGDAKIGPVASRAAVNDAFAAWSEVSSSRMLLGDAGLIDPASYAGCSGGNRVVFGDPFDEIEDPVNCGGILAIGGYCSSSETTAVNGTTFRRIMVGKVVFNNGFDGCSGWNACNLAEVATHEIGHAIGFGHSQDSGATMAATAHFDGRCAGLGNDDVAAVAFAYPVSSSPSPTPTITPTPTTTRTPTRTPTRTATPTSTPTTAATFTSTPTYALTLTSTPSSVHTPTPAPSSTWTSKPTTTSTPTQTPTPRTNVALGKPASQSSTVSGGAASRAVDGATNGAWSAGSVTHTSKQLQPWWEVDLGAVGPIAAVDVWNRTDCCGLRLTAFYVLVSDVPFASANLDNALSQSGVSAFFVEGTAGVPTSVGIGRGGRYVRIQLTADEYLSLAEVQVWRGNFEPDPSPTPESSPPPLEPLINLALGRPAAQSSTISPGSAAAAVDGNTNGSWMGASVSHTEKDAGAWWEVDLGEIANVDTIVLWNRTDCCGARLSDFYVLISGAPFVSTDLDVVMEQDGVTVLFVAGTVDSSFSLPVETTGRYVRVQHNRQEYLSLAEMEVWGAWSTSQAPPPSTPTPTPTPAATSTPASGSGGEANLALGKSATQSSTIVGGTASRAVDGVTSGIWGAGSVTHTANESEAWWQVDLGTVEPIGTVEVWNRTDCCSNRLRDFYVLVSDAPFASVSLTTASNQAGVSTFAVPGIAGTTTTIQINRTGRYVRVQLGQSGYLSLAEVLVWRDVAAGTSPTPTAAGLQNLALGYTAVQQSSTMLGAAASRAVDGITDGRWGTGSVTHTAADAEAWWQVDLGGIVAIDAIKLWNRTDCCGNRLRDFYVLVSDAPFVSGSLASVLAENGVTAYFVSGPAGASRSVTVGRTGRYVRVQLTGSDYLSLAEVEVWGGP